MGLFRVVWTRILRSVCEFSMPFPRAMDTTPVSEEAGHGFESSLATNIEPMDLKVSYDGTRLKFTRKKCSDAEYGNFFKHRSRVRC